MTSAFEKLHKSIYLCDWQLFSLELQKYIQTMLIFAHENVYIHSFLDFDFTLRIFEQVIYDEYLGCEAALNESV